MEVDNNTLENNDHQPWAHRALDYARAFADAFPGRGSATQAEAAAAESVHRQLTALGVANVRTQNFQGQRSIWLFLAQAFGLALVGHAAFWLLSRPLGDYLALLIAVAAFALSFFQLWAKFTFNAGLRVSQRIQQNERNNLPRGPSQNITAVLPPSDAVQHRVVLLAHLDSHRAVWLFAHPLIASAYGFLAPLSLYGVLAAPLFYTLALLTGIPAFGWLALLLALIHFIAWFTGITADLGLYSPGANDNASAVGSLLALAERLQETPLAHTEVWLVFTGCEESGGDGMLHLLAEDGETLKDALFIDLELVGIGDHLAYLETEGVLRPCSISPSVRLLVERAAQRITGRTALDEVPKAQPIIQPLRGALRGVFTEMNIAWEHGFDGVCLTVLSSTEKGLPQWHRLTDTSRNYQLLAFELAHDFVWELLQDGE